MHSALIFLTASGHVHAGITIDTGLVSELVVHNFRKPVSDAIDAPRDMEQLSWALALLAAKPSLQ